MKSELLRVNIKNFAAIFTTNKENRNGLEYWLLHYEWRSKKLGDVGACIPVAHMWLPSMGSMQ